MTARTATAEKREILAQLRAAVSQLEGRGAALEARDGESGAARGWTFGIPALDDHLGGGLARDGLHEWGLGSGGSSGGSSGGQGGPGHGAALAGVVAGLLQRLPDGADAAGLNRARARGVLWILSGTVVAEHGRPYGPGLLQAGLDPGDLLFVTVRRPADVAWAAEEGLKAGRALKAVVGVGAPLPFAASRRLSLAAGEAGLPCLWLAMEGRLGGSSAAQTRWRVASAPGLADPHAPRAPGRPVWDLELVRARDAPPARFRVVWDDETGGFALAAALAAGAAATGAEAAVPAAAGQRRTGRRAA